MSDFAPDIVSLPAYELLDRDHRHSMVDPGVSVDGELITFHDGVPVQFVDPATSATLVYEQLSIVAGIDGFTESQIRPAKVLRSVRRLFDSSSILHKHLSDEEVDGQPSLRQRVRNVSSIPGFRSGLHDLLAWLHQPDVQIKLHTVDDVEFFDEDNPETWRKLHRISISEMVERGKEVEMEPDGSVSSDMQHLQPLERIALSAMQHSPLTSVATRARRNPSAALEWFAAQNGEKRINLLCGRALGIHYTDSFRIPADAPRSPSGRYLRNLLTMLADEVLSQPFMAWEYTNNGEGLVEIPREARVFKGTPLDKQLQISEDPEIRITKTIDKPHHARGMRLPRRMHAVLVRDRIVRPELRAVIDDQLANDGDGVKSRVYGEILLSLLFMQERRNMEDDEVAAIASLHHADPTERLARKLALALIFATSNGDALKEVLADRFQLKQEIE